MTAQQAERVLLSVWNPNADPVTDSVSEMQRLAGALRQAVDVLGGQLDLGEQCGVCGRGSVDLDSTHALAWVRVLRELRTILAEMERLGIAQRGMELAERYGVEIAGVVRSILERLALSEEQQQLVVVVVPEELRRMAIEAGPVGVEAS